MAIREALALADDLYMANIQVASDSKVVVEDIRDNNPTVYGAIIHEIVEHRSNFHTCNIGHESRSSNVEAHKLAKHALSLPAGRHVWLGQP
uniref:RNase H type-1 domain-containing protein n=1 Tax=Triticum urartu TaxID=4572 RepID=A0A8R7TDL6_TRIUA